MFNPQEAPEQRLILYSPLPDDDTPAKLARILGAVGRAPQNGTFVPLVWYICTSNAPLRATTHSQRRSPARRRAARGAARGGAQDRRRGRRRRRHAPARGGGRRPAARLDDVLLRVQGAPADGGARARRRARHRAPATSSPSSRSSTATRSSWRSPRSSTRPTRPLPSRRGSMIANYALLLEAARRPALQAVARRWTEAYLETARTSAGRAPARPTPPATPSC